MYLKKKVKYKYVKHAGTEHPQLETAQTTLVGSWVARKAGAGSCQDERGGSLELGYRRGLKSSLQAEYSAVRSWLISRDGS